MTAVNNFEMDDKGGEIYPDSCSHSYTYDANGRLSTDTATSNNRTWVKTYGYDANGRLNSVSQWVRQPG